MNDNDLILASFEQTADKAGDISAAVYERYFAASPESAHMMEHMDHLMRARMLDEAMMLIMMPDGDELETVLGFEVLTHTNNGVLLPMYSALFDAIRQTVRDAVATAWNADFEGAWQRRIAALTQEINRHYEEVISHQPHAIGSGR
ncbi:MAG: globin [Pseudomonadales bacterium]|jgi:hypothetical protein|nr:globin [Pseudomonadales bacterium]HMU90420.1 globin [Pseudomonadales bacterium]HMW15906.1 globin [Pseudomonadales bacterium]HMW82697.1 globin [Pseudomonadales bacterium]HMY97115.1 globin [Pseudomonadales bacterium]